MRVGTLAKREKKGTHQKFHHKPKGFRVFRTQLSDLLVKGFVFFVSLFLIVVFLCTTFYITAVKTSMEEFTSL